MCNDSRASGFPVVFLSLGPGNPDLLTVQAVRALKEADVVLIPATKGAEGETKSRAAAIIGEWCDEGRIETFCLPMQKNREMVNAVYDQIFLRIVEQQQQGRSVVVAVEGDVSIYASIHYILDLLLEKHIPVVQSPGIPSFIAAAASADLSLICQNQRLVVLPGDADIEVLRRLLTSQHVVVVMKLSQCQQVLKDYLLQYPDAVCHYFENVGTPEEYHTQERDAIFARQMPYFSLCILYPA